MDCLFKTLYLFITFTQSHRPKEAIPESYDKCELGFNVLVTSLCVSSIIRADISRVNTSLCNIREEKTLQTSVFSYPVSSKVRLNNWVNYLQGRCTCICLSIYTADLKIAVLQKC